MWTDDQMSNAKYVAFSDSESKQELNIGTVEIGTGPNQGVYLMRPVPPFGSLSNDSNSVEGMKVGAVIPAVNFQIAYTPRALPVPDRQPADQYIIHDYGKPWL